MKAGDKVSDVVSNLCFAPTVFLLLLTLSVSLNGAGLGRAMGQAQCSATLSCSADTICAGTVQAGDISTEGFTIATGLLLAACSIPNVCQGWLLVICLPVWADSLLTFEQQL